MPSRTVCQWSRRILQTTSLKTRPDRIRARRSSFRMSPEALKVRALLSINPVIGDVFYIDMENHNLTQPSSVTSPQQLLGNPAAPYLNSLMTPGTPNADQTSYASNYDESEGGNTTSFTLPEIVISPLAKGNAYESTLTYTHSSDLKSMQELFGVTAPGGGFLGDANTPGTNDLSDMFVPGVFTPSTLGGTVFKNSGNDGKVVPGLTIVLTGTNDAGQEVNLTTTTGADGSYTFTGLLPGTYSVTVQGTKKNVGISNINLGVGQALIDEDFSLLGPDSKQ
jgi:hypothetical protein